MTAAAEAITANGLLEQIKVLASDEYEGRLPGTRGEELTVKYLEDQFRALGLQPGNPDGTFIQTVPLVGITGTPSGYFTAGGKRIPLKFPQDAVASTQRLVPSVDVKSSDVVFVGYGVVAPEYNWDDYKGLDVKGKTIVMLINDPAVPDPRDPGKLDDSVFKGRAMTYYGRWTYKYEIAAQKGAAAAIIVHQTIPAAYPWDVVQNGFSGERFNVAAENKNMDRAPVESWISLETAKALFKAAGQDFDTLYKAAASREFRPVPLRAKATFHISNKLREVSSSNVVAKLPGSDPKRRDEMVVYSAHWDHFGRKPELKGDQIFNGAVDNASGTAGLLQIAKAYSKLSPGPQRSILFLAVTAEEQGLLGSHWYATHPLYPLDKTLADINMDVIDVWGPTRDIIVPGYGQSGLEDDLARLAQAADRTVVPDKEPEKGMYYRSDHFEFAKVGVPSISPKVGYDFIGMPGNFGQEVHDDYTANIYHKPSDEVRPDWNLEGAVHDLRLFFALGDDIAEGSAFPEWKSGSEFKARRQAMLH